MMRLAGACMIACVVFGAAMNHAWAQAQVTDFDAYQPSVIAKRITGEAPVIDGLLDDPAWREAGVIEDFYQVEPTVGEPSQKTRAFLMYDARNLYIGVYMYDDEPDKIQRSLMERDPPLQDDDAVRILLDPFGTFRDSFFFGLNPNGARNDALTENGNNFRSQWNTIWSAKARVVDDGWIAEFAIPFQSISFDPALNDWNLQIIRTIRRNNEEIRWANINRSRGRIDISNPGKLSGIKDVTSGIGLEGQLFVTGAASQNHVLQETNASLNPSANFFYKITPSLTGSLTFNTDFADAPLDTNQVQTGRFSLFFPETRDFFLQDAASFEFGGRVFRRSPNGLPFFTRRIGIVDGGPVDIIAGAKVSGKAGPLNIGAISTRTASTDEFGGQTLSSIRIATNILEESKIGLIATHGDPTGETDNSVFGADFQYRNSNLIGEGQFTSDFVFLRSFEDGEAGSQISLSSNYDSDRWGASARLEQIDEEYSPRLGFANRTGIRNYRGRLRRSWRPDDSVIRRVSAGVFTNVITDLDDEQLDRFSGVFANAETNDGDRVSASFRNGFLDIRDPFDLAGEVPIPVNEYRFNEYEVSASSSEARAVSGSIEVEWGGAFGGDFYNIEGGFALRPNRFFRLEGNYEFTQFDLPEGAIGIHIGSLENTVAFTPDMTLRTEIQYDNISENFTIFSRFSWEPRPEREVFISLLHGAIIDRQAFPQSFDPQSTGASLRLGYTFRR